MASLGVGLLSLCSPVQVLTEEECGVSVECRVWGLLYQPDYGGADSEDVSTEFRIILL